MPQEDSLVRANVPIFGFAYGKDFKNYRVEYGIGSNPTEWIPLAMSNIPQPKDTTSIELDTSFDITIQGNLATWDTGLKNYVYLPSHPKGHPIDLKGPYTVRLMVTGKNGSMVEDRVAVNVADVIPNAWGGQATSTDGKVILSVPGRALMNSFRLIFVQPAEHTPVASLSGRQLIGKVYAVREPGERFTKEAVLQMNLLEEDLGNISLDRLGIYAYNPHTKAWEYLDSRRQEHGNSLFAKVRELRPYYALLASALPSEGSTLELAPTSRKLTQEATTISSNGHFLVQNTFEEGLGEWSNRDGEVGATVTLDITATFDGTRALKVANTNTGGNFAVNVRTTPFDASEYPVIQFDYRVPPDVKTNFLVKVSGRWYEIGFTDDDKELRNKRVNIAHIGDIAGIVADDQWHTAQFNLYDMLRTKTGNTRVEAMIMADWDVGGYMKLHFGKNPQGATYYIDNFTISREVAAGLRAESDTVLIDHFNQKKATNALGGGTTIFSDGKAGYLETSFSDEDAMEKGHALALAYDVSQPGSYAGYISTLPNLDLRGYHTMTFFVKGTDNGQDIVVGVKDGAGHESKVLVSQYLPEKITTTWQQVRIPLAAFPDVREWSRLENLSFSFEQSLHDQGVVFVDSIAFAQGMTAFLVDDFERSDGRNAVGRKHWTFVSGAAAVNGGRTEVARNGLYRLSYGGNIGTIKAYASDLKSYAGWATELGGIDCSHCGTLSFRIRGTEGGENPSIYLDDGNFRWGIEVAKYATVTPSWQQVTIPLREFADYGVDLTHLAEVQVVFEGVKMSGTIYLDDMQFGSQTREEHVQEAFIWQEE